MEKELIKALDSIENTDHPMINVMKAAYKKAKDAKGNGNYKVYSDEIGDNKPPLFAATIQKQGNSYSFLEVKNISNGTIFSDQAVHNIVLSEIALSSYPQDLPIKTGIEIAQKITKIGKIVVLEDKDKKAALENARRIIAKENPPLIPITVKNQILKLNEWNLLDDNAKALIAFQWSRKLGNKTMVIINDSENVGKDKLREIILFIQKDV